MKDFFSNIFNSISENLISGGAYYQIAKAVVVTAVIALVAWMIAAIVGMGISYFMCYEKKVISNIGRGISFVFRSVPVLIGVWLLYYCVFSGGTLSGIIICGIGIGLYGAGHFSEILSREAKREQARLSENVKNKLEKVYFSAVIPQAMEDSIFHIKRLVIQLLQWTTIAGYITVNDLTEVMRGIGQRTMYPFFSLFFSAIIYMIMTIIIEGIFKLIEKKLKK